eukprot:TRINITY_DN8201_c0_g1_i5.p1 TRINITY_DN8201_c0_g1~~TRINITY_DN8201_c0_g1_i5.p1  ORF type:complete len:294 (-),score=48.73 TRINITY_DN8201_c0_g1_i5:23-904(-)
MCIRDRVSTQSTWGYIVCIQQDQMVSRISSLLLSTAAVRSKLSEGAKALDCTHTPDAIPAYMTAALPKAHFFDVKSAHEPNKNVAFVFPTREHFCKKMKEFGISKSDSVICYASKVPYGAIRAWYLLYAFGHPNAYLMNGNLQAWIADKHPISIDNNPGAKLSPERGDFAYPEVKPGLNVTLDEVIESVRRGDTQFIDSRSDSEFKSAPTSPRKLNYIPGAINIDGVHLFNENGKFKPKQEILEILDKKKVDINKKTIVYCQRGVVATTTWTCLLYTSPSPRDLSTSRMPSSA